MRNDEDAVSAPIAISVKGADLTGINLVLSPLGSISGRITLEPLPGTVKDCKPKRVSYVEETVITAGIDEKKVDMQLLMLPDPSRTQADTRGEFRLTALVAGRYLINPRLPAENWFIRSISGPAAGSSKPVDLSRTGIGVKAGERVVGVTLALSDGAASLQGKVKSGVEGKPLPSLLMVYLIPIEKENLDNPLRFFEGAVENNGAFTITNIAPGNYKVMVRLAVEKPSSGSFITFLGKERVRLRTEADLDSTSLELSYCQRVIDYSIAYTPKAVKPVSSGKK
jgi:hypothetical protein